MRIGELSRQTGITPRAIRHYEGHGLIKSSRTEHGYRSYADDELQKLRIILNLRELDFSLDEIRQLLPQFRDGRFQGQAQEAYSLLQRQLSRVRAKRSALMEVENWLKQLQERMSQKPSETPSSREDAGVEMPIGPQRSSRKGRVIALIDGCCEPFCGPLTCSQPVDNQGSKK
jgi:DNA-binding transcriptional MerR regulator